jgi:hypothetical protein
VATNEYRIGEVCSRDFVREVVAVARGQASAAGRGKEKLQDAVEKAQFKRRRKRRAMEEREDNVIATNDRRMKAALRKAARAAAANGVMTISRQGSEARLPKFKRHVACPLPPGSDKAGWSKPSIDRDWLASVILKVWPGTSPSADAMAALARYVIDQLALAGEPSDVVFTNILTAADAAKGTPVFEEKLVAFCRMLTEAEHDVARKASGDHKVQVYRHFAIPLPAGLSHDARIWVGQRVLKPLFDADLPVIASIQAPSMQRRKKDPRNFHLQLAVGTRAFRRLGPGVYEFALLKNGELLGPDGLKRWRQHIANLFNVGLRSCGVDVWYTSKTKEERGLNTPLPVADSTERQKLVQLADFASQQITNLSNVIDSAHSSKLQGSQLADISKRLSALADGRLNWALAQAERHDHLGIGDRLGKAGTRALRLAIERQADAVELAGAHAFGNARKRLKQVNDRVEAAQQRVSAQIAAVQQQLKAALAGRSAFAQLLSGERLRLVFEAAVRRTRLRMADAIGANVLLEIAAAPKRLSAVEDEANWQRARFSNALETLATQKQAQSDLENCDASSRIHAVFRSAMHVRTAGLESAQSVTMANCLAAPSRAHASVRTAIVLTQSKATDFGSARNEIESARERILRAENQRFSAIMAASAARQEPDADSKSSPAPKPSLLDRASQAASSLLDGAGAGLASASGAVGSATEVLLKQIQQSSAVNASDRRQGRPQQDSARSEPQMDASDTQPLTNTPDTPSSAPDAVARLAETAFELLERAQAAAPWTKLQAKAAAKRKEEEAAKAAAAAAIEAERQRDEDLQRFIKEQEMLQARWTQKWRDIILRNQMLIDEGARFDDRRRYINQQDCDLVADTLAQGGERYRLLLNDSFIDVRLRLKMAAEKFNEAEARSAIRAQSRSVDLANEPQKQGSGPSKWRSGKPFGKSRK